GLDISGNVPSSGGGVWNSGSLALKNLTVHDNLAAGSSVTPGAGGGIYNWGGNLSLTNVTVSGNAVAGFTANGAGIFIVAGSVSLDNVTVSTNTIDPLHFGCSLTCRGGGI